VDSFGGPVTDPTPNVLDLVRAETKRQDDLRDADRRLMDERYAHVNEMALLRAAASRDSREQEAARIDAIRAVDVGAVQRAAEVQLAQASTLAAQVVTSAETLRAAAGVAAQAQADLVTKSLLPLQQQVADILTAIADLRRVQYEQAGQRAQVVETRDVKTGNQTSLGTIAGIVVGGLALLMSLISTAVLVISQVTAK
jgi:hypothetical protein